MTIAVCVGPTHPAQCQGSTVAAGGARVIWRCGGGQVGVAMASAAELSFNWMGFISAMVSNLTFSFRAVLGKKCAPRRRRQPIPCSCREMHCRHHLSLYHHH